MRELRDGTFRAGLTFPVSGITYQQVLQMRGLPGVKEQIANHLELMMNILESDDPLTPQMYTLMKQLRQNG